jgi:putative glycosyltransferase
MSFFCQKKIACINQGKDDLFLSIMKLSIVSTLFCSEKTIEEFITRTLKVAGTVSGPLELILVDDGSPDNSANLVKSFIKNDPRVKLVQLSRNYGHHKAIMVGLSYATGENIFLINSDLEEEPENLPKFIAAFEEGQCDVIFGIAKDRGGTFFRHLLSTWFRAIFNFLTDIEIDKDMVFSRLMSKRYVENLLKFKEVDIFILGLWQITGYKQLSLPIQSSFKGYSSYSISKRIELAFSAITSFSDKPLRFISYAGVVISLMAFLYALVLILRNVLYHDMLSGWTSVIVSIWLMGGLLMSCLGVVGIYVSKIFIETKHRPVIVKEIYLNKEAETLHSVYLNN